MCQEMLTQHSKNPVSATTKAVAKNGDSMHALVECDQKQTIFSSQTSVDAKSAVLSGSLMKSQATGCTMFNNDSFWSFVNHLSGDSKVDADRRIHFD